MKVVLNASLGKAQLQKRIAESVQEFANAARRQRLTLHPAFSSLLANNVANADRTAYLRKLGTSPVTYLARTRTAGANPWPATGLEWQTSSPPPTENFEKTPIVDREAYNYHEMGAPHA